MKIKFIASPLLTLFLLSANCLMFGLLLGSMTMINVGGGAFLCFSLVAYVVGPIDLQLPH